jgi:hypothetical protein
MLAIMPGHGTVGSLSLHSLSIRTDQNRCHETERSVSLSDDIRLNIAIVVLASPNEFTTGLKCLSDHVINETMFIPNTSRVKVLFVLPEIKYIL